MGPLSKDLHPKSGTGQLKSSLILLLFKNLYIIHHDRDGEVAGFGHGHVSDLEIDGNVGPAESIKTAYDAQHHEIV